MARVIQSINKGTFALIVGVWNVAIPLIMHYTFQNMDFSTAVVAVGNLLIVWLGIESGNQVLNDKAKAEANANAKAA